MREKRVAKFYVTVNNEPVFWSENYAMAEKFIHDYGTQPGILEIRKLWEVVLVREETQSGETDAH